MEYCLGLDLGQVQDPSALVVLQVHWPTPSATQPEYHLRYLERAFGKPYPWVVRWVKAVLKQLPRQAKVALVVDQTGVGRPVVDMLTQAGLDPIGITLHGGDTTTIDGVTVRLPKRDLVGALQVCLQSSRLKIAQSMPGAQQLIDELLAFRVKIDLATAHDSYSAWRERDYDDCVLATALAVWWGEKEAKQRVPVLDLSRGVIGLQTPSRGPGVNPGGAARPHLGSDRIFPSDLDELAGELEEHDLSWEEAKRLAGEGKLEVSWRPDRPQH
jgi:hypothetical protein